VERTLLSAAFDLAFDFLRPLAIKVKGSGQGCPFHTGYFLLRYNRELRPCLRSD